MRSVSSRVHLARIVHELHCVDVVVHVAPYDADDRDVADELGDDSILDLVSVEVALEFGCDWLHYRAVGDVDAVECDEVE